jgi:hypothetical protein
MNPFLTVRFRGLSFTSNPHSEFSKPQQFSECHKLDIGHGQITSTQMFEIHDLARFFAFRRTLQNELTPNQANSVAKQIARPTRPKPALPALYFAYSWAAASPPLAAMSRKTQPIASSQRSCSALPAARAVAETALPTARTTRLLPACLAATFATTPIFCAVETLLTARF